jgi:ASC-1-like (ASCH) protein
MELDNEPFELIKNNKKTIEMRLNYKDRDRIKKDDIIEFKNNKTFEIIRCIVLNNYKYKDFYELYKNHNKESIGYNKIDKASPSDMYKYYKKEDIVKYGVLAIEIKLITFKEM